MIALIQRVKSASVTVDEKLISSIDQGLLVLLGVEKEDETSVAERLAEKILKYRVFADDEGKMNLSVLDIRRVCFDGTAVYPGCRYAKRPEAEFFKCGQSGKRTSDV